MAFESAEKKGFLRQDFQVKVVLVVLLLGLSWILLEYSSLLYRSYQIGLKKQWFMEENARLARGNKELEKQYEYYKTDYFFQKEAKRKLNKKEPGEKVIVVNASGPKIRSDNIWEISEHIPEKWWEYFFGAQKVEPQATSPRR